VTPDRIVAIAPVAYVSFMALFMLFAHREFLSVDHFAIFAFVAAAVMGRGKAFVRDWSPPVLLLLGYEYLRGSFTGLEQRSHISEMIDFDRWLFGEIPTLRLQAAFFDPGSLQWYDFLAVSVYSMHVAVPLAFGLWLWFGNRPAFVRYMAAVVLLSYGSFVTYYLWPAMPP
jgi:hypothetical protein